jgi:orotate phosphoribosyltransferase
MTTTLSSVERSRLAKQIAEIALLRGTFTLRSGKTSNYYLDKYLFSTRPETLRQLGPLFAEHLEKMEGALGRRVARVAGAELGGIPLVTITAMQTGLPCIFVRNKKKDYGTAKQIEGKVEAGDIVVLIEDVATTGGQALEAVASLREVGANPVGVIATIDRLEGARENITGAGLLFDALFTKAELGV